MIMNSYTQLDILKNPKGDANYRQIHPKYSCTTPRVRRGLTSVPGLARDGKEARLDNEPEKNRSARRVGVQSLYVSHAYNIRLTY
jgi:hypothetical protein